LASNISGWQRQLQAASSMPSRKHYFKAASKVVTQPTTAASTASKVVTQPTCPPYVMHTQAALVQDKGLGLHFKVLLLLDGS
jgi:hypothetical protein